MRKTACALALALTLAGSVAAAEPQANSVDSIYFVMTDRYANGDPSNDQGGGVSKGGLDPTSDGYFHGGDFKGLTQNLDRIKRLGFTAIWVTPPFVQNAVQGNSAAYHGYWGIDFTTVDPHFGTEADFAEFVTAAHARGMKVILDIVMNHTGDVIRYRDGNSFVSVGQSKQPYLPDGAPLKKPDWLNDISNYTNRGDASSCGWSGDDCLINGDFFGLDDINTSKDEVVQGWIDVYSSWVKKYKIDGFRIDTAKHLDPAFLPKFTVGMNLAAAEAGIKDFTMFGEFYDSSASRLSEYLTKSTLPSLLDFHTQEAMVSFASRPGNANQLRAAFRNDALYGGRANDLVTFLGNHDMGRAGLLVAAASNEMGSRLLDRVKLAHSVLFLSRGIPVVYYGDEVGMVGLDGDKAARQDMFPTKVLEWQSEFRVGASPINKASSLTLAAEQHPLSAHIRALNALRKKYPVLASGQMIPRAGTADLAVWSKMDQSKKEFVILANSADRNVVATVKGAQPRATYDVVFGQSRRAIADKSGVVKINVPARSAVVVRSR